MPKQQRRFGGALREGYETAQMFVFAGHHNLQVDKLFFLDSAKVPPANYGTFLGKAIDEYARAISEQGIAGKPQITFSSQVLRRSSGHSEQLVTAPTLNLSHEGADVGDGEADSLITVDSLIASVFQHERAAFEGASPNEMYDLRFALNMSPPAYDHLVGIHLSLKSPQQNSRGSENPLGWRANLLVFSRFDEGPLTAPKKIVDRLETVVTGAYVVTRKQTTLVVTYDG